VNRRGAHLVYRFTKRYYPGKKESQQSPQRKRGFCLALAYAAGSEKVCFFRTEVINQVYGGPASSPRCSNNFNKCGPSMR
jgi:hypothetical protein